MSEAVGGMASGGARSRSCVTIDLAAVRANATKLARVLEASELWVVVKANGYGHGATDVARAALAGGARALCVATVGEALELRGVARDARLIVLGPVAPEEVALAREARLELVATTRERLPEGVPLHLKLDTGMGRWGLSELPSLAGSGAVAVMTHFASSEADPAFTRIQLDRFLRATAGLELPRHAANSAAALGLPETRLDAARCGIALYGIDPFGTDPREHGLQPALRWTSELARVVRLAPGESTGYGRRFVADESQWIGVVPVGYADGWLRALTGTSVLVGDDLCEVVGTISMDAFTVRLPGERAIGTPVTLVGDGVTFERHARVANTIAYELCCAVRRDPARTCVEVIE